jgi:hypothetical protein
MYTWNTEGLNTLTAILFGVMVRPSHSTRAASNIIAQHVAESHMVTQHNSASHSIPPQIVMFSMLAGVFYIQHNLKSRREHARAEVAEHTISVQSLSP